MLLTRKRQTIKKWNDEKNEVKTENTHAHKKKKKEKLASLVGQDERLATEKRSSSFQEANTWKVFHVLTLPWANTGKKKSI